MKKYLDANGLNIYHKLFKDNIDASYNGLKYYVDSSFGQISQRVENGFDSIDSSIDDLILSDIGLANAIGTLVNERDRKYESLSDKIDNFMKEYQIKKKYLVVNGYNMSEKIVNFIERDIL